MLDTHEIIKKNIPITISLVVALLITLIFVFFQLAEKMPRSFSMIQESGHLRIAYLKHGFHGNDISTFSLKTPEFLLLDAFAKDNKLKLEILPLNTFSQLFSALDHDYADLVFDSISETKKRKEHYLLTNPFKKETLCIVAHNLNPNDDFTTHNTKTILVPNNHSYIERSKIFSKTEPFLNFKEDSRSLEELLDAVAQGDEPYTIAEKSFLNRCNMATQKLKIVKEYPQTEPHVFMLPKSSDDLCSKLNDFIQDSARFFIEENP